MVMVPPSIPGLPEYEIRVWLEVIFQFIAAIGVVVSIYVSLTNRGRLKGLHEQVNGRMTEMIKTTKELAAAEATAAAISVVTEHVPDVDGKPAVVVPMPPIVREPNVRK